MSPQDLDTAPAPSPPSARGPGAAGRAAPPRTGRGRAWLVPALAFVVTLLLGVAGIGTHERLANGGYTASGTESERANRLLADRFGGGSPDLVLLVRAEGGVDTASARAEGRRLTLRLARAPGVGGVRSYWSGGAAGTDPALRSEDGTRALVTADLTGADRDAARTAEALVPELTGRHGALRVQATGPAWVSVEAGRVSQHDLVRAEVVAAPLTLLILVLALRSLVAALVPLVIGVVAVVGTIALLRLLSHAMPVSVFAMNLTTALGFGLAVDYGLFLVTRYREELRTGKPVAVAVERTARRAGHTVAVSACTVALSMSALLVLPLPFLRSMACAGIAVALLAAATAGLLVPPVLNLLGTRVDRWDPLAVLRGWRRSGPGAPRADSPAWRTVARVVTRRPVYYGGGCALVLLLVASPFAHVHFGLSDERVLPAHTEAHRTSQAIREGFTSRAERNLTVVLPDVDAVRDRAALSAFARRVAALPSVARHGGVLTSAGGAPRPWVSAEGAPATAARGDRVRVAAPPGPGAVLTVTGPEDPQSRAGRDLVKRLRSLPAPGERLVTGRAAHLADTQDAVRGRLPLAAGIVAVTTWAMLFLLTGSVLLPVKALVIGALSLGTSFGLMVHVFQDGHLRRAVGEFTVTGTLDMTMPLLMFVIAFGLAIDYEIFLLSRVKEHHALTGDNRQAVVEGVARTGRLVTTGALAVAVVTGALATSGVTLLKLLGTGLAVAVLVDAVLVRGVLVPACLTLAGRANWWTPAPLARAHAWISARTGLDESR
ncbi:MMPL family transporter [Streptomyces netropsis]|uniref:RND superfamily putative drug exporter n=1 Tax=Streptomyces netropsis TaxID=55404 RepID=A0A7W7L936_STRNE|nr:MMPL family transporter [Streptomyces netropsis]MBB4885361.1 RND superfamily putative drug exporter [Streptomyces netropsis]GGR37664.1 membrane protein [Streptomyces netropsis]